MAKKHKQAGLMNVSILKVSTHELTGAVIKIGQKTRLPSIHENWRFNFDKQIRKLSNATAYVLVSDETPDIIEGCMIFQMKNKKIPYMAFVEVAPHNLGDQKKYDYIAGCLIAYAFKQSIIHGKENHKGILIFDVLEENMDDQDKLMSVYQKKYNAIRIGDTTMAIMDENGHRLVEIYLNRK